MLENIIGHAALVDGIRAELREGRFPRAVLFFGPPYGGKLSTALEVARALTCQEGSAAWSCECASCRSQKELMHPHTVLLGWRPTDVEIAACGEALVRSRKTASHYLFVRAVRKLTRRFDTAILDPDDARAKGAQEKVARLEELLSEIPLGQELPADRALGSTVEKVIGAAAGLSAHLRPDGIAVGQVRVLSSWAHLTASGSRKVAIMENADRMLDSARNAMLKLLEEPPESVFLILVAARRGAILPTILSRLRPYHFMQRSPEEEREVLAKIFRREGDGPQSLRGFFLSWKAINPETLAAHAERFLRCVSDAGESVDILSELSEIFPERGGAGRPVKETGISFLEELAELLRRAARDAGEVEPLEQWRDALRDAQMRMDVLNMAPQAVVESLFYRMRGARAALVAHGPGGSA